MAVLEAGRVASGVTGYTTAKVTSLHGAMYADLLKDAGFSTEVSWRQDSFPVVVGLK